MSIFKHKQIEAVIEPPSLGSFPNFTKKEIYTQGDKISELLSRYVKNEKIMLDYLKLKVDKIKRVYLVGSGTDYAAALFGAYNFEVLFDVISAPINASEFMSSNPILDKSTLVVIVGDYESALYRAKASGAQLVCVGNSTDRRRDIALDYDALGDIDAQGFTLKLVGLSLLSIYLGEKAKVINRQYANKLLKAMEELPKRLEELFEREFLIRELTRLIDYDELALIGTNVDYSIAIYGSIILSKSLDKHICFACCGDANALIEKSKIIALASSISFYSLLDNELDYQLKITSSAVKIIDNKTLYYNESLPMLNPIISAAILQLIAYFNLN